VSDSLQKRMRLGIRIALSLAWTGGGHFQVIKRRLSPSDKQYQQAFAPVLAAAFHVPSSSPAWETDLLAQLDGVRRPEEPPHSRQACTQQRE